MTTQLISHPFRITPSGQVATRPDGDDDYYAEQLGIMILTQPGERELVPSFGLRDPAFGGLDFSTLQAQIQLFGPPITLNLVRTTVVNDAEADVVISFSTRSGA